jgi:CBS domain containing-hemolysin-like protein
MVPRPDVVSVPSDMSLSDLRATVLETEHTRYPVVDADDVDQAVGYVDIKDLLRATDSDSESQTAGDLARDIVVVPETTTVSDLLLQFRDEQRQMAAVIDEWGVFEGIATIEDVVEAIPTKRTARSRSLQSTTQSTRGSKVTVSRRSVDLC